MLKITNLKPDGTLDESARKRVLLVDDNGVPTGDWADVEMRTIEHFEKIGRKHRKFERDPRGQGGTWTVNTLAATNELLRECVRAWSVQAGDGSPAPISDDAIRALDPRAKTQIRTGILGNEMAGDEEAPPSEAESFREPA